MTLKKITLARCLVEGHSAIHFLKNLSNNAIIGVREKITIISVPIAKQFSLKESKSALGSHSGPLQPKSFWLDEKKGFLQQEQRTFQSIQFPWFFRS